MCFHFSFFRHGELKSNSSSKIDQLNIIFCLGHLIDRHFHFHVLSLNFFLADLQEDESAQNFEAELHHVVA